MALYFAFSGLFNALTSAWLGLLVFFKNKKNKINQALAILCLSAVLWSVPYIFWPLAKTKEQTLFWFRLLHIGSTFISIIYLHFVVVWLNIYKQKKKIILLGYLIAFLLCPFIFTPLFIRDMVPKFSLRWWAVPGPLYHFYLLFFFFYATYSTYLLFLYYRRSSGRKKLQIKYFLIGVILSYLGGSTNYFLWYNINIPPYGNILSSLYVIFTVYAIVAHQLMDIKLVLRRSTVTIFSLISIFSLAVITKSFFLFYFPAHTLLSDFVVLLIAVFTYPFLQNYFYYLANKYFFSSLYDSKKIITELSEKLRSTLEIKNIYNAIINTLQKAFHTSDIGIFVYDSKKKKYQPAKTVGLKLKANAALNISRLLHQQFVDQSRCFFREEVENDPWLYQKSKKTIKALRAYNISLVVPLNIKNKAVGLILLGEKETKEPYNEEDLSVLRVISAQAAITIENALLYQEVKDFNIKLKKEVNKATHDLRQANEELKKLDEAKSEFISIASHQLRTPLTVIKGYGSMLLEGNFGPLNLAATEAIKKMYTSNERLIRLVENLLNISRIEAGRLEYNFQPSRLEQIAQSVCEELETTAEAKKIKLRFNAEENLPVVMADEEKIRQVVLNLIDNAIKYSQTGKEIKIEIKKIKNKIQFCVTDQGIGIDRADMNHLFKKFIRGKKTALIHTEGTGLGLYVARKIIMAHQGKIWAQSQGLDQGSTFCFYLPIKP